MKKRRVFAKILVLLILMVMPFGVLFAEGQQEEGPGAEESQGPWEWPSMLIHMDTSTTAPTYVLSIAWTPLHQEDAGVNWRVKAEASANAKLRMLKEGKCHFWWNTLQSVSEVMEGNLDYATRYGGPSDLRVAHPGFNMMMAMTVLGDSGIETLDDIEPGMKYAVPVATPIIKRYYKAMFAFCGIDADDMIPVEYGSFPATQNALSQKSVDIALVDPAGIFARKIASGPAGIHYLGFPSEEEAPDAYARFREVTPTLYFGENHAGVEGSVGVRMIEMRNTGYCLGELDPEITYRLVKWMDENFARFKDKHWAAPMMNIGLFKHMIEKTYLPVHEGTIRYLREKGMWSDADDRRQVYNLWLSVQYITAYDEAIAMADEKGIEVTPGNPEWQELWSDYKIEKKIPKYRIMEDEEIELELTKLNL